MQCSASTAIRYGAERPGDFPPLDPAPAWTSGPPKEGLRAKKIGLSDAEASELGRLFAEYEGKPYSDAAAQKRARQAAAEASVNGKTGRRRLHRRAVARMRWLEMGETALLAETDRKENDSLSDKRSPSEAA